MGCSIEGRPAQADERQEFGHWKSDSVIGQREIGDLNLLTLTESKTRYEEVILVQGKESQYVNQAFTTLKQELGPKFAEVFKTSTADKEAEFSKFTNVVPDREDGGIYHAHPYVSYERAVMNAAIKFSAEYIPKGNQSNHRATSSNSP